MPYRIKITEAAGHELRELPGHVRQRVRRLIETLPSNPTPPGSKELRGLPGRYRVRLLDWRIRYRVDQEDETVLVLTVRRKTGPDTYRDLDEV